MAPDNGPSEWVTANLPPTLGKTSALAAVDLSALAAAFNNLQVGTPPAYGSGASSGMFRTACP